MSHGTSSVAVGIYDPFEVYPKIQDALNEKVQLTNLHWRKNSTDALRSIPQLRFTIKEETPKFFDDRSQGALTEIKDAETAIDDVNKILNTPYARLMFVQCDNLDIYRAQVRPLVNSWKEGTIEKSNCPIDWHIVYLQTDPSSKSQPKVLEKLKIDNNMVDGADHCILLKLKYTNALEENESWGLLSSKIKSSMLFSFSQRLKILQGALTLSKDDLLLSLAVHNGIIKLFFHFSLLEDALRESNYFFSFVQRYQKQLPQDVEPLKSLSDLVQSGPLFMDSPSPPSYSAINSHSFSTTFLILEALALSGSSLSISSLYVSEFLSRVDAFISDTTKIHQDSIDVCIWVYKFIQDILDLEICTKITKSIDQIPKDSQIKIAAKLGELFILQRAKLLTIGTQLKGYHIEGLLTDVPMQSYSGSFSDASVEQLLLSKVTFENHFLELTESAITYFGVADRARCVDALSIDIALLDYQNCQYGKAALILSSCPDYYGGQGWKLISTNLLQILIDCFEHMDENDEFFTKPKEELLAESYISLLSAVKETTNINYKTLQSTLNKLCLLSTKTEFPQSIKYDLDEIFAVEIQPSVEPLGSDSFTIEVSVNANHELTFPLKEFQLSLSDENAHVITFSNPQTELRKGSNSVILRTDHIISGIFKCDVVSAKLGPVTLVHELAHKPEINIFTSQRDLDLNIKNSTRLNLTQKTFSIFIKPVEDICNVGIEFSQLGGILELDGSISLYCKDSILSTFEDSSSLRNLSLEASKLYEVVIPVKMESIASKLLNVFVKVSFTSGIGLAKSQAITGQLDTALKVEVSVQDIFRFNSLYSKFNIGTSDPSTPIRIIDVDLNGGDSYKVGTALKAKELVAFPEQPGNYFFKLEKIAELEDNNYLALTIEYRDFADETSSLWKSLFYKKLEEAGQQIYFKLLLTGIILQVDYEAYEIKSEISFLSRSFEPRTLLSVPLEFRTQLHQLVTSFINTTHPKLSSSFIFQNQLLKIRVPIPTVEIQQQYELKLAHSKMYTSLGEEIDAQLTIKSLVNKHTTSGAKKVSFQDRTSNRYEVEISPNNDSWLINGQTKFTFEIHKNSDENDEEQFEEKTYKLSLIPLKIGKLSLPRIKIVKEDISFKLDEYALEIDYQNENETIFVVSEKT